MIFLIFFYNRKLPEPWETLCSGSRNQLIMVRYSPIPARTQAFPHQLSEIQTTAVSAGSRRMDYFTKLFKYRTAGVREYWIVDHDRQRVTVYNFEAETTEEYSFGTPVPSGIYEGFSIEIKEP